MKTGIQIPIHLLFTALALLLSVGAYAQNNTMFVKIKGAKQGDFKGDVFERGKEGLIKVVSYSHEIVSPRDAASGQATGKRQHKPMVIIKEVDKATPQLYAALANNEVLTDVTLTFYRPSMKAAGAGGVQWFTIKLTNASIAGMKSRVDDKGQVLEELSLVYQKIIWTYTDGGVTHEDSWNTQN
jgi:type VI secretion system secreted protein Hcp